MAAFTLTNQKLFLGGYNLTGVTNAIALEYAAELKDATVYGADTRINKGGLKTVQLQAEGFYDAAAVDSPVFTNIGVADTPISILAEGNTDGDIGYFFKALAGQYTMGESVGEMLKYSLGAGARSALVKGQVLNDSTETATGNGTAIQVGAASATQTIYAVLHVVASSGTGDQTLDVTINSDDNSGITSGALQFTFTQATTSVTSQFMSLAGPLTDDWFRATFTIGGTGSPSFTFMIMLGILEGV